MTPHHGQLLRRFLDVNGLSAEELAEKIGVHKGTIYNWIKKPLLDLVQLNQLKQAGVDITVQQASTVDNSQKDIDPEIVTNNPDELKEIIKRKDMQIAALEARVDSLIKLSQTIAQAHEVLRIEKEDTIQAEKRGVLRPKHKSHT